MKLNFKRYLLLIVAICVLMLSACNKNSEETNQNNDGNSIPNSSSMQNNQQGGFMGNSPDVYGEVKSISGGQVTLAVLEMPQRRQMTDEERQKMMERREAATQNPQGKGSVPSVNPDGNNGRRQSGGGFMGGQKKYTGENVTLTISADTPITAFDMGNRGYRGNRGNRANPSNGAGGGNSSNPPGGNNGGNPGSFEEKKLALSDIKVGSLLQIWYKKDSGDKKEIEKIRVIQIQDNQSQNTQGNKN